ncbi:hypothetical protein D018_2528B, partial [Vibrio parahaemolyticus VP2007-007]
FAQQRPTLRRPVFGHQFLSMHWHKEPLQFLLALVRHRCSCHKLLGLLRIRH